MREEARAKGKIGIPCLARSLLLLANLLLLSFCLTLRGPCTRSGRTRLGYEPVCVGLVQPLNFENKGLFKQDLKPVTGKVRRVSETQLSPRQHTNGLALLASDADSGKVLGGAAGSLDAAYLQSRLFCRSSMFVGTTTAGADAQISRQGKLLSAAPLKESWVVKFTLHFDSPSYAHRTSHLEY